MADIPQTNAQIAAQITTLIQRWNEREAQIKDWLGGAADGGPNGDGKFPLSPWQGPTSLVFSPAALADLVSGPAGLAQDSAESAEDSAETAANFALNAENDRVLAQSAHSGAVAARDLSLNYQEQTEWYWSQVLNYHGQVQQNTADFLQARDDTLVAHAETLTARDDTLIAKAAALAARDLAQGYAASINPAILATKAEVSDQIAAVIGTSQATLDTLQEIGAALGNDPNFATTMTNQLAGKAPLSHTHTTAQITGLDTALAGKAALSHTHAITDVIGLQAALDLKANLSNPDFTGAVSVTGSNQLLLKPSGTQPTVIHRNDGGTYYFLLTAASASPNTSWNSLRPLSIAIPTGRISSANGQSFSGGMDVANGLTVSGGMTLNGAASFNNTLNFVGGTVTGHLALTGGSSMGNNPISAGSNAGELEIQGNGTGAAAMTFHRPGAYAVYFGLDTDNKLKVGGWSMGAVAYALYHEGNKPTLSQLTNDAGLLVRQSGNRPGVTRLYRRDEDSNYSVQNHWTGSYWHLRGYSGDTFHAECYVERSGSTGYADSSGVANNAVGYGQKWYQETWAANTTYQNTYGRPIMAAIHYNNNDNATFQVSDNGSTWVTLGHGTYQGRYQVVIPSGHYWRVSGSANIVYAATLR